MGFRNMQEKLENLFIYTFAQCTLIIGNVVCITYEEKCTKQGNLGPKSAVYNQEGFQIKSWL